MLPLNSLRGTQKVTGLSRKHADERTRLILLERHQPTRQPSRPMQVANIVVLKWIRSENVKAATRRYPGEYCQLPRTDLARSFAPAFGASRRDHTPALINQLQQALYEYYPAALEAFDDWTLPAARAFVEKFPTPPDLVKVGKRGWEKFLHSHRLYRPETYAKRLETALEAPSSRHMPPGSTRRRRVTPGSGTGRTAFSLAQRSIPIEFISCNQS